MTLANLIDKIYSLSSEEEFCDFINNNFEEIQLVFNGSNYEELYSSRFKLSDLFYDIQNTLLRSVENEIYVFKNILADYFERFSLAAEVQSLSHMLQDGPVRSRLEAALLYLRINDVNEYSINFPEIIKKLMQAYEEEDFPKKLNLSLANYFFVASKYLNDSFPVILERLKIQFIENSSSIPFLSTNLLDQIKSDTISDLDIRTYINEAESTNLVTIESGIINDYEIEEGEYADQILNNTHYSFDDIIALNRQMLQEDLYDKLGRGIDIIEDPQLLYQYIKSYGKMHKSKLFDGFDSIDFSLLKNKKIEIIDWGCGQAIASLLFLEYIHQNEINLHVKSLKLIEPSEVALKRGLLHLNKWQEQFKITPIHKDLDKLIDLDIATNSASIKFHLFSNILDVPTFNLKDLIAKIKKTQANLNYFICLSPYIDENKNMRIEAFYNNFNDNYDTILISDRKNNKDNAFWNCSNTYSDHQCDHHSDKGCNRKWTRYEKIFFTNLIY